MNSARDYLRRLRDENGQVVIMVALCASVLIGFLGLAVEVGYLRFERRHLQAAADAVAVAAALELNACGATTICPAMQSAVTASLADNNYSGATVGTGCTLPTSTVLTLTLNAPTCVMSSDPNRTKNGYVEAILSETVQGSFSKMIGFNAFHLTARAEAGHVPGACVYALDPTGSNALNVGIALGLQAKCPIVVESSSASALVCGVGLGISAPEVSVTGGVSNLLCVANPAPHTGAAVPTPADPLAYLPAPAAASSACPTSTSNGPTYTGASKQINLIASIGTNLTFNPGVYCGGIAITASVLSTITFNPGIYVFKNGPGTLLGIPTGMTTGGLTITAGVASSITGNGVLFYNAGNAGGFSFTGSALGPVLAPVKLSAATTGTYAGILFFQAHGVTNTGTFLVNAVQTSAMNGIVYEPDALVTYGVSVISNSGTYNGVVAKDLQFSVQVLSTFYNDYSNLPNGSPLNATYATLVQ